MNRSANLSGTDLIDDLIREHRPAVLAYVLRLTTGDRARAEDVVQETFVRAWARAERMSEQHGSVRGWLKRVAHNLAVDDLRSRRNTEVELRCELPDAVRCPDEPDGVLTAVVVRQALCSLPDAQRAVLVELYLRDRTVAETARVLHLPVGTVKSRTFYALRRLREVLSVPAIGRPQLDD